MPAHEVEALLDAAFGADRRGRTAYRLRAGLAAVPRLSLAAIDEAGALLASTQSWEVALAGDDGTIAPLLLLGPIAVRPDRQRGGLGRAITTRTLAAIDAGGIGATVLIGDPEYYGRFGFDAAATAGWRLPGPVERRRLLARLSPEARLPAHGALRARPSRPT